MNSNERPLRGGPFLVNEELHNLCRPTRIIVREVKSRAMWPVENVTRLVRSAYRILVGNFEHRRPLVRSRRRHADNIKIYLKEIGCVCRIHLADCIWGSIKGGEFYDHLSDCQLLQKDFVPWNLFGYVILKGLRFCINFYDNIGFATREGQVCRSL